jgi:glycosyltransferase involved in cell wall biosynthesis
MNVEFASPPPEVSVIVPARNEEACLGDCLESLVTQNGVGFEVIVVDDYSTDRTREIAESFAGVRVISPGALPAGWTGKNNAVIAGAGEARGGWLLFTDADTVHLPGSLARALEEAKREQADLLSYSPEQIAVTFWEMAVLPVVFAELARQYPPKKVSDPGSPVAAANGQFILIRREAYEAAGGHRSIADSLLEDVALAGAVKSSGRKIRFRYAADAVRTRMYRNFRQLREGWTKNLARLFPRPGWLAVKLLFRWGLPLGMLAYPLILMLLSSASHFSFAAWFPRPTSPLFYGWFIVVGFAFNSLYGRLHKANFDLAMEFLGAWFGYPMFAYLLLRSKFAHAKRNVEWKGRKYSGLAAPTSNNQRLSRPSATTQKLRTNS